MRIDRLERSKMRLVRRVYMKIDYEDKDYYFLERAYASKYDGMIEVDKITKETFDKAVKEGKRVEIKAFEDAKRYIQNRVLNILENDRKCS